MEVAWLDVRYWLRASEEDVKMVGLSKLETDECAYTLTYSGMSSVLHKWPKGCEVGPRAWSMVNSAQLGSQKAGDPAGASLAFTKYLSAPQTYGSLSLHMALLSNIQDCPEAHPMSGVPDSASSTSELQEDCFHHKQKLPLLGVIESAKSQPDPPLN
ncbi:hypothetical protein BDV12DRAFT_203997 [Aspergillus spectabilis]